MDGIKKYSKEWFATQKLTDAQKASYDALGASNGKKSHLGSTFSTSLFVGDLETVTKQIDNSHGSYGIPSSTKLNAQIYGVENIFNALDANGDGTVTEQEVQDVAALSAPDYQESSYELFTTEDLDILYNNALAAVDAEVIDNGDNSTTFNFKDGTKTILNMDKNGDVTQKTSISVDNNGEKTELVQNYQNDYSITSKYDEQNRLIYKDEDYAGKVNDKTTTIQYGGIEISTPKTNNYGSTAGSSNTAFGTIINGKSYSLSSGSSTSGMITTVETAGTKVNTVSTKSGYVIDSETNLKYNSDGKIGDTSQEDIGDCWVLAGVNSLRDSAVGRHMLDQAITQHPDGSITVELKGVGKSYTYTPDQIGAHEYHTEDKSYSTGDVDMNLFEMAIGDYRKELIASGDYVKNSRDLSKTAGDKATVDDPLRGGQIDEAIYYITGLKSDYICNDKEAAMDMVEQYQTGVNKYIMNVTFNNKDESVKEGTITTAHAYSITKVDDDYVYVVNPWNSSVEIPYAKEDFFNNAKQVTITDLMPGQYEQFISAMPEDANFQPIKKDDNSLKDKIKDIFGNIFS